MSESLRRATTFYKQCNTRNTNLFGFPCLNPSLIFQRILNDILKTEDSIAYSRIIADSLHQDHKDIANAMKELHRAYPDVFVLKETRGNAPVQITELGKLLLDKPMLQAVKNGLHYKSFVTTYQRTLSNLTIDEGWVVTTASYEHSKDLRAIPRPNTSRYQVILHLTAAYRHSHGTSFSILILYHLDQK